jgi:hypothetical protein
MHDECTCCGAVAALESDHIVPRALGGSDDSSNRQWLCKRCNVSKGTMESCHIDHSMDNPHDSNGIDVCESPDSTTVVNRRDEDHQAGPPAQLSTRISSRAKAVLLKQAQDRGVAVGVIIEELLDGSSQKKILQQLDAMKKTLDRLAHRLDEGSPPPTPFAHRQAPVIRQDQSPSLGESAPRRKETRWTRWLRSSPTRH